MSTNVPLDKTLSIGYEWLRGHIRELTTRVIRISPSEFSEKYRYLPESVSPKFGPMRFDVNPFAREIVDCFDQDSYIREVNLKKGVQITYTTMWETILLYYIAYIGSLPCMYVTADKELATARIEGNVIPMLHHSGFIDRIKSADLRNNRKTGKTKDLIQWEGGGKLIPYGANNADKMRQHSIAFMGKDELDAWPDTVGKDGDPDTLTDDRLAAYWEVRKIFRGGTPLLKGSSKVEKQYLRGDQRKYHVKCLGCGYPQELRWSGSNPNTGHDFGIKWDYNEDGTLAQDSVRYVCAECAHDHYEYDKDKLFDPAHGAEWVPTATPVHPTIRSYHLPSLYSPVGMQPWYKSVQLYLEAWDTKRNEVKDIGKYQVFYNNVLAEPFKVLGQKVEYSAVSAHRRHAYKYGEVPQQYARKYSGGPIRLLTCQVDVHHRFLAVAVMGWTKDRHCYLISYEYYEDNTDQGCGSRESKVWTRLEELIERKTFGGMQLMITFIDAGWQYDTVVNFCSQYEAGVYPIIGRPSVGKFAITKEFKELQTQAGTFGYQIQVDYYKDRISSILRRHWVEDMGEQPEFHFNAPVDATESQLKELTREVRKEKINDLGHVSYVWYRPGNARNELWDLLVYGHAAVEIIAWEFCTIGAQMEGIDWGYFWNEIA